MYLYLMTGKLCNAGWFHCVEHRICSNGQAKKQLFFKYIKCIYICTIFKVFHKCWLYQCIKKYLIARMKSTTVLKWYYQLFLEIYKNVCASTRDGFWFAWSFMYLGTRHQSNLTRQYKQHFVTWWIVFWNKIPTRVFTVSRVKSSVHMWTQHIYHRYFSI